MCFQCWLKLRIGDSATSSGCHLSVKSEAPDWLYRATFLQATAWAGAPSQLLMEQTRENLCCASPNTYVVAKSSHLLIHLGNPLPYTRLLQWTQFLKTSCRVFSIDVPRLSLACGRLLFFIYFMETTKIYVWVSGSGRVDFSSERGDGCQDSVLTRVLGRDERDVSAQVSSSGETTASWAGCHPVELLAEHVGKNSITKGVGMPPWEFSCSQLMLRRGRKKLWLFEPEKDWEQEKKGLLPAKTWKSALLFYCNLMTLKHYILLD